jgi:hypothetical protein
MQIVRLKDETQVAAQANKYGLARAVLVMTKDITSSSRTSLRHPIRVSSVVLPDPEGPMRIVKLPRSICKLMLNIACLRASPVPR